MEPGRGIKKGSLVLISSHVLTNKEHRSPRHCGVEFEICNVGLVIDRLPSNANPRDIMIRILWLKHISPGREGSIHWFFEDTFFMDKVKIIEGTQ